MVSLYPYSGMFHSISIPSYFSFFLSNRHAQTSDVWRFRGTEALDGAHCQPPYWRLVHFLSFHFIVIGIVTQLRMISCTGAWTIHPWHIFISAHTYELFLDFYTAYHSWLCGKIAQYILPEMVELGTSRGIENENVKVFPANHYDSLVVYASDRSSFWSFVLYHSHLLCFFYSLYNKTMES